MKIILNFIICNHCPHLFLLLLGTADVFKHLDPNSGKKSSYSGKTNRSIQSLFYLSVYHFARALDRTRAGLLNPYDIYSCSGCREICLDVNGEDVARHTGCYSCKHVTNHVRANFINFDIIGCASNWNFVVCDKLDEPFCDIMQFVYLIDWP